MPQAVEQLAFADIVLLNKANMTLSSTSICYLVYPRHAVSPQPSSLHVLHVLHAYPQEAICNDITVITSCMILQVDLVNDSDKAAVIKRIRVQCRLVF